MKYFDRVRVISDGYEDHGIYKGDEGHILNAEIRGGCFDFYRENPLTLEDDANAPVRIEDLEVVESSDMTDKEILEALPLKNPAWWCKVEDGYIINLKGEKLNTVPYKYNSCK